MENVRPLRSKSRGTPKAGRARSRWGAIVGVAVVVTLIVLVAVLRLYVEWLWFGEVGRRDVFWTSVWTRVVVGALFGAVFFAVFWGNVELARRLAPKYRAFEGVDVVEYVREGAARAVALVGLIVSLVLALIVGSSTSSSWLLFQRALNGVAFGKEDPLFGRDLGFYVFTLPAWSYVRAFALGTLIGTLVAAAVVHAVLGGVRVEYAPATRPEADEPESPTGPRVVRFPRPPGGRAGAGGTVKVGLEGMAIAHLSGLLAAIFAVVGVGYIFAVWNLLFSRDGVVFGAGYADMHARVPALRILMVLVWALAAMLIVNIWRRRQRWLLYAIGGWIIALIALQGIWPALMQSLSVNPNQESKERPYIGHNLALTRAAYALEGIGQKDFPNQGVITPAVLRDNQPTLSNIRLWDPATLVRSYEQLQQLRPYYSFMDVDVDRYTVKGVYRQTMAAARELNIDGLPSQAQTWVNQHITYTHGFGLTLSAVNQVTDDGSPDFLVKDIPLAAPPDLAVEQPRLYYGELGTEYTLVKTKAREFDYPGSGGDVYTRYEGDGGIPIGSLWNKLAFSVRFSTIKFFTTNYIDADSRIIIRNNLRERLTTAAPFLSFDGDPYIVIADGRLFWIADAYTTTDRYPYSEPLGDINYLRNSVKAVVDAYDGTVTFYVFEPRDPIIRSYQKIFPEMFRPLAEMPASLRQHARYPEDMFNVQAEMFTTYHVEDPQLLYNKGDQWQVPENVALSGGGRMDAYYVIMRLPDAPREEFILILPFVPNGRPNMVAWLGARADAPNYGSALSFDFPQSVSVYGPAQVEAAINQDPAISAQRSLWDQQGSRVILGNLLVVPIDDSLLYVQPLYLESEQTQLPQLKRVIVFYQFPATAEVAVQTKVVMASTLSGALTEVFGEAPETGPTPGPTAGPEPGGQGGQPSGGVSAQVRTLIEQANRQFEAAQEALRAGDFAEYGRQIESLKQTLSRLRSAQ